MSLLKGIVEVIGFWILIIGLTISTAEVARLYKIKAIDKQLLALNEKQIQILKTQVKLLETSYHTSECSYISGRNWIIHCARGAAY